MAGVGVAYGYKGKGILIHSITDANGMPVVAITTPANGDERQQVLTMLAQIRLATGKRGNPKRLEYCLENNDSTVFWLICGIMRGSILTVESLFLATAPSPKTLAADKGYDARWLRKKLRTLGIRPQIKKRQIRGKKPKGRPIKETVPRYQQERSFSWFQRKYRRLVVRWERLKVCFDAFLLLACSYIWFPKLVG